MLMASADAGAARGAALDPEGLSALVRPPPVPLCWLCVIRLALYLHGYLPGLWAAVTFLPRCRTASVAGMAGRSMPLTSQGQKRASAPVFLVLLLGTSVRAGGHGAPVHCRWRLFWRRLEP